MRAVVWIVTLAAFAAYGLYAFATLDRRGDDEVLRGIILDAARAAENRDVGGIMESVSTDYKDSAGLNHDQIRMLAAQAVRSDVQFKMNADIDSLSISRDSAKAQVHVTALNPYGGRLYDRDLTIKFVREPARHMLVIPTRAWRVKSIDNHGLNVLAQW